MTWLPKSVVCLSYYDRFRFRSDVFAALVLALQIFPVAIAIAVATGVHPLHGITCTAVAGLLASALGDSKIRIGGPNIIFVAVASSIVAREGVLGLSLSTLLAGVLLMFFGAIGLGTAIQMLPRSIAAGFSTGIAVLVVSQQLPNLLGINSQLPAGRAAQGALMVVGNAMQVKPQAIILALATLILTVACRRRFRYIPAGLIVIAVGALLVKFEHFPVRTIEAVYGSNLMSFHLNPTGTFRLDLLGGILPHAFPIAVLAAIESLKAMGLATRLTGEGFNADSELFLQAGANVASAFAGALPVSGVSSYTSKNAHLGAQTPMAGILQVLFLVVFLFLMAPFVRFIPLPMISALILLSVCRMTHWREIPQLISLARAELAAWFTISLLTIVTDLSIAIGTGMLLGMFLYVRSKGQP